MAGYDFGGKGSGGGYGFGEENLVVVYMGLER